MWFLHMTGYCHIKTSVDVRKTNGRSVVVQKTNGRSELQFYVHTLQVHLTSMVAGWRGSMEWFRRNVSITITITITITTPLRSMIRPEGTP